MMLKQVRTYFRVWAMGLLSLFAIYYASITLFAHVHVINGVMLVHSHPFKTAHTHTEGQLLVLQTFSVFGSLEPETLELAHVSLPLLYSLDEAWTAQQVSTGLVGTISLRAPPVSFLI